LDGRAGTDGVGAYIPRGTGRVVVTGNRIVRVNTSACVAAGIGGANVVVVAIGAAFTSLGRTACTAWTKTTLTAGTVGISVATLAGFQEIVAADRGPALAARTELARGAIGTGLTRFSCVDGTIAAGGKSAKAF